jgi:hypothetical protein
MNLKPNDSLQWDGDDGILKYNQQYLVWQTREGRRKQEFTLKYPDWWMVEPVIWWESGEPFIFLKSIQKEAA